MDERRGRALAQRRRILGTAYQREIIDDPLQMLSDMRRNGFRAGDQVVASFAALLRTEYKR